MARIFKQQYTTTGPDGRKRTCKSRKWYLEYRDADRIRRRVPGFPDKQATQQLAAELERKAVQQESGLRDRFADHRKRRLREHLVDFRAELLAKGNTKDHADLVVSRVTRVLDGCGFRFWPEIEAARVQVFVSELRTKGLNLQTTDESRQKRLSIQTRNFYIAAAKQFARWMVKDGRAPDSPLAHLQGANVKTDRRHDRRALSDEELRGLLTATKAAPVRHGMSGPDRAMLYRLAVETGLRASELRSLTWQSFRLKVDPPTVTVSAAYSKRRREDVLPLKADTVASLGAWREQRAPLPSDGAVFPSMPGKPAKMLRADLRRGRAAWIRSSADRAERRRRREQVFLAYRDDAGCVADFHALRHTFITNLARGGVHPKLAQQLARHSTITLTMDRYSHTVIGELSDALTALPNLAPNQESESDRLRATGTCDEARDFLPDFLPKNLPNPISSQKTRVASRRTLGKNRDNEAEFVSADSHGTYRTSVHPDASQSAIIMSLRPAGLEPATPGLGNRCSIQLSYERRERNGDPVNAPAPASVRKSVECSAIVGDAVDYHATNQASASTRVRGD